MSPALIITEYRHDNGIPIRYTIPSFKRYTNLIFDETIFYYITTIVNLLIKRNCSVHPKSPEEMAKEHRFPYAPNFWLRWIPNNKKKATNSQLSSSRLYFYLSSSHLLFFMFGEVLGVDSEKSFVFGTAFQSKNHCHFHTSYTFLSVDHSIVLSLLLKFGHQFSFFLSTHFFLSTVDVSLLRSIHLHVAMKCFPIQEHEN